MGAMCQEGKFKMTTQVFRLKTEVYQSSRNARIKPFKTFLFRIFLLQAEMNHDCVITPNALTNLVIAHDLSLKAFNLQPIHLSSYPRFSIF